MLRLAESIGTELKHRALKYFIVLAVTAVAGIILVQFTFLKNAYEISEQEFHESVSTALKEVAWQILEASGQASKFDNIDPIERVNRHCYLVNVNDIIDPVILKTQLKEQLKRHGIRLDFEYSLFDPEKKMMVYGDYICGEGDSCRQLKTGGIPLSTRYDHYFGVNFPDLSPYFNNRLNDWYILTGLLFFVLFFFGYALWVIIRQRQLSDIQKLFINNLTHELKTPISSIGLSAQVLSDEQIVDNPQRLSEYVRIILEQSNRLARNVEKVLNLASLEKNRIQLVLEKTDLDKFVGKTTERFLQSETGMHASIRFTDISPGETIWADLFHFANVIQNILENAAKYCKRPPEIEISILKKGRFLCLSFRDNGIGIPRAERKKIFRKFYRVSTGNIHDVKGFGLGLDYVSRIVKAHRWKIKVGENNNGGSVFMIMIPKKDD